MFYGRSGFTFKRPARILLLLVLCLGLLATAWAPTPTHAADYNVTINTGTTLTASGNFQGFGVQEDTNWMWLGTPTSGTPVVPGDYNTYVAPRLQAMKLPWVRKFIDINWYEASQGTYTWTNNAMTGLYMDLQELKNNGTNVMLTMWRVPTWIDGGGIFPQDATEDSLWATATTALLQHLYGTDGSGYSFTNIKWVGGPNELEWTSGGGAVSGLDTPYSDLATDLTTASIRSNVTLFGPDTYTVSKIADAKNDGTLNPLLGFYDYHDYESSQAPFDSNAGAAISNASGSGKQVWLTEFGDSNGDAQNWNVTSQWAIEALNDGYAAASIWTVGDEWYCGGASCLTATPPTSDSGTLNGGEWGLWAYKDSNYAPRLSYYAYSDITAHTAANSKVYANSCGCTNLGVSALNDQNGHDTILVMNWNSSAESVNFSYSGASPTETMYRYTINSSSQPSGNLEGYDKSISMSNGSFSDIIPAGTFAVYSSLNPVNGSGSNLLTNPGFETGDLTGWNMYVGNGCSCAVYVKPTSESPTGYDGSYRLDNWNADAYAVSTYQTVPSLTQGHAYTASAWVYGENNPSAQLDVYDQGAGTRLCSAAVPNNAAWTQISCQATVDSTDKLTVALEGGSAAGVVVLWDDVSLTY